MSQTKYHVTFHWERRLYQNLIISNGYLTFKCYKEITIVLQFSAFNLRNVVSGFHLTVLVDA